IAAKMGIGVTTLYSYKKKYPKFLKALKRGKEVVDREVEKALLNNALGYNYTEEQVTNDGRVVEVNKYNRPQTTAAIFWLKNRKPEVWRDKKEIDLNSTTQDITDLSEKEREKRRQELRKKLGDN
ncbi:MAG: hypothetical protein ACLFUI_02075, partial [Halanaerobiales bacterium]